MGMGRGVRRRLEFLNREIDSIHHGVRGVRAGVKSDRSEPAYSSFIGQAQSHQTIKITGLARILAH